MNPDQGALGDQRVRSGKPTVVFVAGCLLAVLVVGWLSLVTQPTALASTAWWPVAGIAVGLGIRFPRRHVWALAATVAAITLPLLLWAGRPAPLAIALALTVALEMIIATLILRGRNDCLPTLSAPRDLGRLLLAVGTAAVVYDLVGASATYLLADSTEAWIRLVTSAPKHAAGMLLLVPLFMHLPRRPRPAGPVETVAQVVTTLGLVTFVFAFNPGMPLSFLPFMPLVWVAMRLTTRELILLMLGIAVIASAGSAYGTGPFAFQLLDPEIGNLVLQVFELSMVVVFLSLSLAVGQERTTARRLNESEELFRRIFDTSVAGMVIATREANGWKVLRANDSAVAIVPGLADPPTRLSDLLGDEATAALSAEVEALTEGNARLTLTTSAGRILNVSISLISDDRDSRTVALQFYDITEAMRARRLEQEELERAAEVQRALLPGKLPPTPGWSSGAASVPAKQVGGDFYDIRVEVPHAVLSLGDVMGKGMGAGMLAAATRAALRANDTQLSPSAAMSRVAGIVDHDLQRTSAFITLTYVLVDLVTGDFRFADAGHGLHFIVRTGSNRVERAASSDLPVGLDSGWDEKHGALQPGDALLLVSDGVMDLWGGSVEQLSAAVAQCARQHGTSPQALVDALCARANGDLDRDDVTAVVLRREPVDAAAH
ncbi:serine/threonine protein phosphatase [Mycobacterium sp. IS-1496]|uniref:SpoIIE family protein phosphatase n=1 Tax=Mycobacterium sp. IS-1496 TaxID=1772284 RepID=UPI0007417064|nr:SpoIIE family protein phosphatase [Mycobacterium sp. IS-1496]KUI35644.1 serine/threonine protein phosphatase [Mycobacterium sp. IS-1496]